MNPRIGRVSCGNKWLGALFLSSLVRMASGASVSFVACPIAQDTGPDTDICFFTEHQGQRFALTGPIDWGAPQLGHRVLVEGILTDEPRSCGGIVLDGRFSVLPELAPECNTIVPFDATVRVPPTAATERARRLQSELAAVEKDPLRSLRPVPLPPGPPVDVAIGRTEVIYYPFDSDRSSGPDAIRFVKLAQLARDTPGASITVSAYRGASLLDDGTLLAERPDMAVLRANKVAGILEGLGAPASRIHVRAHEETDAPAGRADWKQRRVEVTVEAR